jgi:hypothetical protein
MTDKSPLKKRLNNAEEEELESGKKRQKVSNEEAKNKPVVPDSSEGSFDGSENDEDDSFDDDFDQDEGEEGEEGSIDIEAYKKWREEHPEEGSGEDLDDDEEGEIDMEEGESQLDEGSSD